MKPDSSAVDNCLYGLKSKHRTQLLDDAHTLDSREIALVFEWTGEVRPEPMDKMYKANFLYDEPGFVYIRFGTTDHLKLVDIRPGREEDWSVFVEPPSASESLLDRIWYKISKKRWISSKLPGILDEINRLRANPISIKVTNNNRFPAYNAILD